jgi:RNA polymerase sigma factor (sigma-70 family)
MDREIPLTTPRPVDERFDKVMEEYGRLLRTAIARLCPPHMAAECDDIRQDASIRLWRALASGREIPSLASYVYRIAASATIDAIRRVKARREETLGDQAAPEDEPKDMLLAHAGATPERTAALAELVEKVHRERAALLPDRSRAVGLHLQGLTTQEIGDLLGWSEAKARNLVYRGLHDLRSRLRAEGIDYEIDPR